MCGENINDIVKYVEDFAKDSWKKYENATVSELPRLLGLSENNMISGLAYDIADIMQREMINSLFEDEAFLDIKIVGCVSNGMGMNAFILSIHPFTVAEHIEITEETDVLNSDYLCYCIVSTKDKVSFQFSFLNAEDIYPSPFDGVPIRYIKELLPL